MLLVHYGRRKFDLKKFEKISNTNWVKPDGGFWTSPVNAKDDWKSWCEGERFRTKSLKSKMFLELRSKKILKINSFTDLKRKFFWKKKRKDLLIELHPAPDFEKMSKKYDAIYLTSTGQRRTRFSRPYTLYGWDCECVLILNGKKLKQLTKHEYENKYKKVFKTTK